MSPGEEEGEKKKEKSGGGGGGGRGMESLLSRSKSVVFVCLKRLGHCTDLLV